MSDNNNDNKTTLSQDIPENAQDLTIFVQNLLEQMVCLKIISIYIIYLPILSQQSRFHPYVKCMSLIII